MAAAGPAAAMSRRPSRLPLHRCRSSTDKSSPTSPGSSSASYNKGSNSSVFSDAGKAKERPVGGGSRPTHHTSQVELNRYGRPSVANVAPRRQLNGHQRRDAGVSSTAATGHGDRGVISERGYAVRPANNPSCGMRMSLLRSAQSAGRHQPPTSSVKSSSSAVLSPAARFSAAGVHRGSTKPRDQSASHYASTSSIDSTCSDYLQYHAPVASRHPTRPPTASPSVNSRLGVTDRKQGRSSNASQLCRKSSATNRAIVSCESNESISSRSNCQRPPASRRLLAGANKQPENMRRRSDGYRSTSGACRPIDIITDDAGHQQHSAVVVEPRRRYCQLWRYSESNVDSVSLADSMSTLTSVDSSSTRGTLTDADESSGESDGDIPRRDRGLLAMSSVCRHEAPPSVTSGHQSHANPVNRCTSHASSSPALPSPASALSTVGSRRPAENHSKDIQRIGNFGITPRPAESIQDVTSPQAPQSRNRASSRVAANRPKSQPSQTSAGNELVTGSRSNIPSSRLRLSSESASAAAKNTARHIAHTSSVAADRQMAVTDRSAATPANSNPVLNSSAMKAPNSSPYRHAQSRQNVAVKKGESSFSSKTSLSHLSVSSSSTVVDEKQSPLQRTSVTANQRAASKIPSMSDETRPHTQIRSETVHSMDNSRPTRTSRHIPTASTRTTKLQAPATVVTGSSYSSCGNDQTAVSKRPPPPPSKLKRPSSVHGAASAADRRRVSVTERSRPASTDCSAIMSSASQQPVDARRKKSESCANVASIEDASMNRKRGMLNKNDQLARSYDCITPRNSELQDFDMMTFGSSASLVDIQPPRLVKPYSVINRCLSFGRRMATPKQNCSTTAGCSAKTTKTDNVSTSSRPLLASQARVSKLTDLPEVDEQECDRPASPSGSDRDDGRQVSVVERTEIVPSPPEYPRIQQMTTESYRYRSEYSTFVNAFPSQADDRLTVETVQVASTDNSSFSFHPGGVSTPIKQDGHDEKKNLYRHEISIRDNSNTEALQLVKDDDFEPAVYDVPVDKSCVSADRSATLGADIPLAEDATASAETSNNYVVTYESENIVVLDREPVVDCLTPDGDVVCTEVRQLLSMPADSVATVSSEGGLSRSLPLSESGYDTWKSSEGSVAVVATCVGSTCNVTSNASAGEQQRQLQGGGTLRVSELSKTCDTWTAELCASKDVCVERCETSGDSVSSPVDRDNLCTASTDSALAAVKVKADDESPNGGGGDNSGRVSDGAVEDSVAQMCVSICSDAAKPVANGASSPFIADSVAPSRDRDCRPSPLSAHDNAASGLTDPTEICLPSQTDTDILSSLRTPPNTAAHLDRCDEKVDNACSLLPESSCLRRQVDMDIIGAPVHAADDVKKYLHPADISTRKTSYDFDEDCFADSQRCGVCKKVSDSVEPLPVSTYVVSDSMSLDSYETICDDLLEALEATVSNSGTMPRLLHTTCQTDVAPCSTNVSSQEPVGAKLLEPHEQLTLTNHRDITSTKAVAARSNGVDRLSTHRIGGSAVSSGGEPLSTAVTGCLPPATTLRRVRTNFAVVCRQPTVPESRQQSSQVKAKVVIQKTTSDMVDPQSGPVGCRQALAVLASRLGDHSRGRDADGRAVSRPSPQPPVVTHDPPVSATSPAVILSSRVRPVECPSTVTCYSDATAGWNNVDHVSDLQSRASSVLVHDDMTSVSAGASKLPISTMAALTHRSVSKKPSTFRKLSSKLTNVVRRTQTKRD